MELKEYINILKKNFLLIIIVTLLAALTSAMVSFFIIKPVYKTDISVIIGKATGQDKSTSYNDILLYQKQVKTYGELAKSRTLSEDVIKKLGLKMTPSQLQSLITVAPKGDTEFLTITVKSTDPEQAVSIANQMAKSLKDVSYSVRKEDNVMLVDDALLPGKPDSPKPYLNIAIAFFMGLMVSVGISFLIEYLDNTVKSEEDIERFLGIPVIGIIPLTQNNE